MKAPTLTVRIYGDPCLRQKCDLVEEIGPGERMLIQSMLETMHAHKGVGLAAPQVGIKRRIFVADIGDGPIAVINPKILKEQGAAVVEEGCLSIPEVTVNVQRSEKIWVRYTNINNETVEQQMDELLARVFQHENDHLDGKLIVDYASDEEKEKHKEHLKALEEQTKEK